MKIEIALLYLIIDNYIYYFRELKIKLVIKVVLIRTYNSRRIARKRGKHAVEPGVRDDHKR